MGGGFHLHLHKKKSEKQSIFSEDVLDDLAISSPLRKVPAAQKLVLCIAATVIAVLSPVIYLPLFVLITMIFASLVLAKVPVRIYLSLLTIPLAFGLTGAVVLLFVTGGGETIYDFFTFAGFHIQITDKSLNLAMLVLARTFAGMCSLYFLTVTTPVTSLFKVLRDVHLPQEFIDLTMLIYRYIFVFIGEAIDIHNAQVMRGGYSTFRDWISAFSMLTSMLFIRTWEKGEDIFLSMNSRCYDGVMLLPEEDTQTSVKYAVIIFAYLSLLVVILALEMIL